MANTATPTTMVRTVQGDTLSSIVWRHLGRSSGNTEAVLAANPTLADMPAVLPAGIAIALPDQAAPNNTPQPIKLWD